MGLNISRRLAEQVSGRLWFDETYGPTCFVVELPRYTQEAKESLPGKPSVGGGGRILLVEDEKELADALKFYLEEEDFAVEVCHSGEEAHLKLKDGVYDVVLCDFRLPDFSGEELLRRSGAVTVNWIFMTGYSDVLMDRNKATPFSVLRKPIPFNRVVEAVREVLQSPRPAKT